MASSSISSSKRRFAVRLGVLLVLLFVLDAGIGALMRVFYFRQTAGENYRSTYIFNQTTEDIIVLGSSRAKAHYVPSIFEDVLGQSCYNGGRDGQSLFYGYAAQEAFLKRYRPGILILDLYPRDFFKRDDHYARLSALLPYYDSHREIRPIVHLRTRGERLKLISKIYPFNSLALQIAKNNFIEEESLNGYVPQYGEMEPLLRVRSDDRERFSGPLDPNMVHVFRSLITNCVDSGIRLFVVISPIYQGDIAGETAISKATEILNESGMELWNYSNHSGFVNESHLFRDRSHLNDDGARLFSEILAKRIEETLGSNPR